MLGIWRSHSDYQHFMVSLVNREFRHNPKSIKNHEAEILKMYHLNLDNVRDDFIPLFSVKGRPSNCQPEVLRSLLLMSSVRFGGGIDKWVNHAAASPVLCALAGVTSDTFPGASTHRDFIARLWQADTPSRIKRPRVKPKGKHGKNKLPSKRSGIVATLVKKALSGEVFKAIPERLLQAIFMRTAVVPSVALGLLGNPKALTIAGDGTCIESNASHLGRKLCGCGRNDGTTFRCNCPRSFTDPLATWGWDSYKERWFYGYTGYLLSVHNKALSLDLPIYMKFVEASRNDSATAVTALAHARYLYKDILGFGTFVADAIHDNYPTYDLCNNWGIKPVIALNGRYDDTLQSERVRFSKDYKPICADGHEMANWGHEAKKHRIKYRCPMVTGKVKHCPYAANCNKTLYGKIRPVL